MRRWLAGAIGLLVAVAALLLAVDGTISPTSRDPPRSAGNDPGTRGATTRDATVPRPRPVTARPLPVRLPADTQTPAQQGLERAVGRALAPAGPQTGVYVYDLSARRPLVSRAADVARPPASVEKLWTTVALLRRLGPSTRLQTSVLGSGRQRGATWDGDLFLRGGGDPTFGDALFNRVWNHGEGTTPAQLAAGLARRGIRRVTGPLFADASLFDARRGGLMTDLRPDTPDFGGYLSALVYDHGTTAPHYDDPAVFAAHMCALALRGRGISVAAASRTGRTPPGARLLATVSSPPIGAMTRLMDVPSDDLFAELFTKQLGVLFGDGGTIASGARVIAQTIATDYGIHPLIRDGSGLGRVDRTSPRQIVELLRDVAATPTGRRLDAALPAVGVNGTVQGIAPHTAARGRCLAKTGTLDGVTNLAGYCRTRGGHTLAFGLFADGPPNATAFAEEGRALAAIARF